MLLLLIQNLHHMTILEPVCTGTTPARIHASIFFSFFFFNMRRNGYIKYKYSNIQHASKGGITFFSTRLVMNGRVHRVLRSKTVVFISKGEIGDGNIFLPISA